MADIILGQHPMLKKEFVDKRIKALLKDNFVADKLFTQISVDALAIKFAMEDADVDANGKPNYDDVPEVGEGSNFDRIGLSEKERTAMIRKYGLEAVITYEMQKFGANGQIERAYRKLAMNVAKMVDVMAYNTIVNSSDTQGLAKAGGFWNDTVDGAENMIADLIDAKKALKPFGYMADTVVMNSELEAMMLKNKNIRDAFRQNNTDVSLLRGYIGDFMGLSFIVDDNIPLEDGLIVLQNKVIGDIADAEGLKTKTYNEESNDRTIVRATRFTQAYLTDPKAIYKLTNITN